MADDALAEAPAPPPQGDAGPDSPPDAPAPDPEAVQRYRAARALVRQYGDPVLRATAVPVERFDDALRAEVQRMARIMDDGHGIGLAATQLGVVHRVLTYRVGPDAPLVALVNPRIEWTGEETEWLEEGCLSLPDVLLDIERPIHVRVRAVDERGADVVVEASGLEARVIQHEVDHLDGVLILDRAPRSERKQAIRALREAQAGRDAA